MFEFFYKQLEAEHRENKSMAYKLRDDIKTLWERLQISDEERENFCADTNDDTPTTIKKVRISDNSLAKKCTTGSQNVKYELN